MEADPYLRLAISLLLIAANGLFVAAEYGLVGTKRSRVEALAKKGSSTANLLLAALDDISRYIAGIQVGITMCGIAIGAFTEPFVSALITQWIGGWIGKGLSIALAFVFVTFLFVVIGELVPKYVTLRSPERVALALIRPISIVLMILSPLVWLVQRSGAILVLPFGIRTGDSSRETLSKDELMLLVAAGRSEGVLDEAHAVVLAKALKFDVLDAEDVMIHRLDIQWIDLSTPRDEVLARIAKLPHTRIPICRGDIDEVAGFIFVHDVLRHMYEPDFSLERILRPLAGVPENLPLSRVIERMREDKTQILIVVDEYGGTSGLITLEDVVEEVFGELQDQLESERPPIEVMPGHRISARADVRYDELVDFLNLSGSDDMRTDTLATLMVNSLGRVPKLGDSVETPLGLLRVENMARRRITRVSLHLSQELIGVLEPDMAARQDASAAS